MLVSSPADFPCQACADGVSRLRVLRPRSARPGVLSLAPWLLAALAICPAARGQFPIRQVPERWNAAAPAAPAAAAPQSSAAAPAAAAVAPDPPLPAVCRITVPERDGVSYGSGTLIDARDKFGLVVTNWHVVRDATGPITVEFSDGHKSPAEVIRTDANWDLAALSILRPKAEPLTITPHAPQIGEWLSIAGYGGGQYRAATGFVRAYNSPSIDLPQEFIELSAEARHGDSGGPILNERGEVCGVLFGSAPGYTCGAYGGRVRQFLATVIPGGEPGSDTAPAVAIKPPDPAAAIAQAQIGPPRNFVPVQSQPPPQATALHESPPAAAPYVASSPDKDEAGGLTSAQGPPAKDPPIQQWPAAEAASSPSAASGAADDELGVRPTRAHAPVPPRSGGGGVAIASVNDAPPDQLLAATWRRFGGTTLYDQAKSVLAIFGLLAVVVQVWKFSGRREAEE